MYDFYLELKRLYLERVELNDMMYIPRTFSEQLLIMTIVLAFFWAVLVFASSKAGERFFEKIEWLF